MHRTAENKAGIEDLKKILEYALGYAGTEDEMTITVTASWPGDDKAATDIPEDVARWLIDWCDDTLACWSQPG